MINYIIGLISIFIAFLISKIEWIGIREARILSIIGWLITILLLLNKQDYS